MFAVRLNLPLLSPLSSGIDTGTLDVYRARGVLEEYSSKMSQPALRALFLLLQQLVTVSGRVELGEIDIPQSEHSL